MNDITTLIPFIGVAFLLAGFVKGVVGLGLPTVAIGLLGLVMAPVEAAALLIIPSLLTNLWQAIAGAATMALIRRLWPMLAGICGGTWAGAALLAGHGMPQASAALGVALAVYALIGLARVRLRVNPHAEPWLSPLVGGLTGVITVATGVFVIPAVPFLQALALSKDDLVQALGLSFLISTVALGIALAQIGALFGPLAGLSALALFPALAGMGLGQRLRDRISPDAFRLWFFLGLLVLGSYLALGR